MSDPKDPRAAIRTLGSLLANPEGRRLLVAEVVDYFFAEAMRLPREPAAPLGEEKKAKPETVVVEATEVKPA